MKEEQLVNEGYRKYIGDHIEVFFTDICERSGNCVRGSPNVFDTKRKPWIIADAASTDEVAAVIWSTSIYSKRGINHCKF